MSWESIRRLFSNVVRLAFYFYLFLLHPLFFSIQRRKNCGKTRLCISNLILQWSPSQKLIFKQPLVPKTKEIYSYPKMLSDFLKQQEINQRQYHYITLLQIGIRFLRAVCFQLANQQYFSLKMGLYHNFFSNL